MTLSIEKLNKVLGNEKSHDDTHGLRYLDEISNLSTSKITFLKPNNTTIVLKPTQTTITYFVRPVAPLTGKVKSMPYSYEKNMFVPMCHHCGRIGHIRPNYRLPYHYVHDMHANIYKDLKKFSRGNLLL